MHTFLMVLLWVVLGLLALLAVLLIVPAAVAVEYKQGEFTARLKLLGIFSFRLYPMKEKADRKKKKTPPRTLQCPRRRGAGDRTRTGTLSPAVDFESTTSTNSITPAEETLLL